MKKAKRGDLIVVHERVHSFGIGIPSSEYDNFHVGVVTNITRDGQPKKWRNVQGDAPCDLKCYVGFQRYGTFSTTEIDVDSAMNAARKHYWPHHESPMPYASLDEVKAALTPFRKD